MALKKQKTSGTKSTVKLNGGSDSALGAANENEANKYQFTEKLRVEFYAAMVQAWVNTKMEKDKSVLTISSVAVGFLVTIYTGVTVESVCAKLFAATSVVFFLVAIIVSIVIFDENGKVLELQIKSVIDGEPVNKESARLNSLDKILNFSFILGILFFVMFGAVLAFVKQTQ